MFCQADFGVRIKELRRVKGLSQREAALQMGVSEQAISKWESGACLPDVYHLKLLGKVLGVSVDCLLDVEREQPEKVLETFQAGGAVFELVEKPETILAGKLLYAKDFGSIQEFDSAIEAFSEEEKQAVYGRLVGSVLPVRDIQLSVNFWLAKKTRGFGFMREVTSVQQPIRIGPPRSCFPRSAVKPGSFLPISESTLCRPTALKWPKTGPRSWRCLTPPCMIPVTRMCRWSGKGYEERPSPMERG